MSRALPVPPDFVVEATGKPGALQAAIGHAATGGTVVSLGMCTMADPIIPAIGAFKDISLCFPLGYAAEDFVETIRHFDAGRIKPRVMVTETVPLAGLPALVEEMRGPHDHLKVQIVPE